MNTFTVCKTTATSSQKQFRGDFAAATTLEAQQAAAAKATKLSKDRWMHEEQSATMLELEDAAWCGKALLSEAIRFQYTHSSKRLTKVLLERCPLMGHAQRRYEEDCAFNLEEKTQQHMVGLALYRAQSERVEAGEALMTKDEVQELRAQLDREIEVPEICPSSIVAPMAPELARAMWADLEVMMGAAPKAMAKCAAPVPQHQAASLDDVKAKYNQAIGTFTQLQLWRVKKSKNSQQC